MDPIAAIADFLTTHDISIRREVAEGLHGWYAKGGFKPELDHVKAEVVKRGYKWSTHRAALAIFGGAVP